MKPCFLDNREKGTQCKQCATSPDNLLSLPLAVIVYASISVSWKYEVKVSFYPSFRQKWTPLAIFNFRIRNIRLTYTVASCIGHFYLNHTESEWRGLHSAVSSYNLMMITIMIPAYLTVYRSRLRFPVSVNFKFPSPFM